MPQDQDQYYEPFAAPYVDMVQNDVSPEEVAASVLERVYQDAIGSSEPEEGQQS